MATFSTMWLGKGDAALQIQKETFVDIDTPF